MDVVIRQGIDETPLTKMLINERWDAYRRKDWERYNELRHKIKLEIRKSKTMQADKFKRNVHGMWRYVNFISGKKNKDSWCNLILKYGNVENLLSAVVSALMENFDPTASGAGNTDFLDDNWNINLATHEIKNLLSKLSPHKSPGIDGIPNRIYSLLAENIAGPLKSIYEASIAQRKFPTPWKTGVVAPVPKTNPTDIKKLRPITLLPAPAKIFEKVILNNMKHLYEKSFSRYQHAFKTDHSTTTALLELHEVITKAFDDQSNFGSCTLCIDLSKAFDRVDHSLLIKKLKEYDFPTGHLLWLKSYLTGRRCMVRFQGEVSQPYQTCVGVPQGSVLGPALFCAFTGDFNAYNSCSSVVKYADDISIILPIKSRSTDNITELIKEEVQQIDAWCSRNKLCLNKDKTNVMVQTRIPITLPDIQTVDNVKILGTIFSSNLTWDAQVSYAACKFNQRFHILRKLKHVISREELHQVYTAIMRPLLEYSGPVYVSLTEKLEKKIRRLNNRAHKLIWSGSIVKCCCEKEILKKRREQASKALFRKVLAKPEHSLHRYLPLRMKNSSRLMSFFCRTEKRRNSFFPFVTEIMNKDAQ